MLGIKIFLLRTQFLFVFMLPELEVTIPVNICWRFQEERQQQKKRKPSNNVTD